MRDAGGFDWDQHVQQVIRWHFDPRTGSPYWLQKAATLGFDPRQAVRTVADLDRFPAVADDLRETDVADLIPRGCKGPFDVWESGGTTGSPRRIVDGQDRVRMRAELSQMLDTWGFPPPAAWVDDAADGADVTGMAGGAAPVRRHWLHIGPTGPHLVGRNVARLARERGALCHTVDLDPRWIKQLYRSGRADEARRYIAHLVSQALTVLRSQPVEVLTTTPPLLQALLEHNEGYDRIAASVKGIVWTGTSMSDETHRLLSEELLPGIPLVGWYGNTLMGIACQRPPTVGDPYRCIFQPPAPAARVALVDPADPAREVGYGERGRVKLSVLTMERFLPWILERDTAVRVAPRRVGRGDDLAQVAPLGGAGPQTEGVY